MPRTVVHDDLVDERRLLFAASKGFPLLLNALRQQAALQELHELDRLSLVALLLASVWAARTMALLRRHKTRESIGIRKKIYTEPV